MFVWWVTVYVSGGFHHKDTSGFMPVISYLSGSSEPGTVAAIILLLYSVMYVYMTLCNWMFMLMMRDYHCLNVKIIG